MKDAEILKPLVDKLSELSSRPCEEAKKELWSRHNALLPDEKIPVCVTWEGIPFQQWDTVFGRDHMRCSGRTAREIEMYLKRCTWVAENVPDDHVVWPAMYVSAVQANPHDWGVKLEWESSGEDLGARHIIAPFEDEINLSAIRKARTEIDAAATESKTAEAQEITGGALAIHPRYPSAGHQPFETAVLMRGMEKIFFDVYDRPELIHGMMEIITEAMVEDHLRREKKGWLNCAADASGRYQMIPVFRHVAGYTAEGFGERAPEISDEWAYLSAQSAMGLGPAQYDEFVHRYNSRIAELFSKKTVYYHGCECLDQKLDVISTLPNLRRHHVSPWSSVAKAAEKYRGSVNLEVHVHPGKVLMGATREEMREEIKGLIEQAGGHRMNLNLSDIHSLDGRPETLRIWAETAQELAG